MGLDVNSMHVMKAQEIIEHYVSGYDQHANEYDFKKALDLLQYVPKVGSNLPFCWGKISQFFLILGEKIPLLDW